MLWTTHPPSRRDCGPAKLRLLPIDQRFTVFNGEKVIPLGKTRISIGGDRAADGPRKNETFAPVTLGHIRSHGCRDQLVYCDSTIGFTFEGNFVL
jgi:hypothetical protein